MNVPEAGMRATGPPGAAVASCVCVASRRTRYGANAAAVEITTSSPAVPLNEYRSARTLVPKMGEVQSDVSSAPALTSPTVIGTSVNAAPQVMLTAMKLNDSGCVNVGTEGENTDSRPGATRDARPSPQPRRLQKPAACAGTA